MGSRQPDEDHADCVPTQGDSIAPDGRSMRRDCQRATCISFCSGRENRPRGGDRPEVAGPTRFLPPPFDFNGFATSTSDATRLACRRTNWWPKPLALPDPFWDTPTVDIPTGTVQPLWIEVDVPREAEPGEYVGTITLQWDGASASLPIRLTVWDFEMPRARHQQVTNWFAFPGVGYRAAWGSPEFWELADKYARIMTAHRQTCFKAELGWIRTTYNPERGYRCDFRFLDQWAETFFAAGLERMELFQAGRSSASVDDPAARITAADLPVEVQGETVKLTPEAKLEGVLGQLEKHVREKRWTGRVMLHVHDEPFLHSVPSYRKVAEIVHRAAPSLKVIEAVEATGFGNAIDVLVPKLNHLNLWLPHFQKMQREGKELWSTHAAIRSGVTPTASSISRW